ncbi:unnamed protein product [Tenebrio molitor]|nr:unnamed protein product [Tenebrio molitor]
MRNFEEIFQLFAPLLLCEQITFSHNIRSCTRRSGHIQPNRQDLGYCILMDQTLSWGKKANWSY